MAEEDFLTDWSTSQLLSVSDAIDMLSDESSLLDKVLDEHSSCLVEEPSGSRPCWGGLLSGFPTGCTPGFVRPTVNHFKDKLCPKCRSNGITIPIDRIRPLPPSQVMERGKNARSTGLWSRTDDGHEARLINHTAKCSGPPLLIYRHPRPQAERASWSPMPSGWLEGGADSMRLVLGLGTLRPAGGKSEFRQSGCASSAAVLDASIVSSGTSSSTNSANLRRDLVAVTREAHPAPAEGIGNCGEWDTGETYIPDQGADGSSYALEPAVKRVRPCYGAPEPTLDADLGMPSTADFAAVAAAINDEAFQREQDERLRVCAAGFGSLDSRGREVMHRMFSESTRLALVAKVGELPVARVVAFVGQGYSLGSDDLLLSQFVSAMSSMARLAHCIECMLDMHVWESCAELNATKAVDSSTVESLADSLVSLSMGDVVTAAATRLNERYRKRVNRSVALVQKHLQAMQNLAGGDGSWREYDEQIGCEMMFGAVEGVGMGRMCFEIGEDQVDVAYPEHGPPNGWAAEAREIIDGHLMEDGMVRGHIFSSTDMLWQYDGSRQSFSERVLTMMCGAATPFRCIYEELDNGIQIVFFGWDESEQEIIGSKEAEDGFLNLCVLKFVFLEELRRWRCTSGDCIQPVMTKRIGWLESRNNSVLSSPFINLARWVSRASYRKMHASIKGLIAQRNAVHCWAQQAITE